LAEEIIEEYGPALESITLVRGGGGRFEVTVNGNMIFSKAAEHRHANPREVVEKMRKFYGADGATETHTNVQ
jgi:selT/selW/selH-like putative selenoprotein